MNDETKRVKNFTGNPRQRGLENEEKVLVWLFRWGWCTEEVLQKLLGVKRRIGIELVKRGVLQRIEPPRGHKLVYVIARSQQARALELYEAAGGAAMPYTWGKTSVPFAALGQHNELAQLVALNHIEPGDWFACDRELSEEEGAIPDFIIQKGGVGGVLEWHEVELHAKYKERLYFQLWQREEAREENKLERLVWHCGTQGIAKNLEQALSSDWLPAVDRRGDGRIVILHGVTGWQPKYLKSVSEIRLIDPTRKRSPSLERGEE